jgi:hypothetical protein
MLTIRSSCGYCTNLVEAHFECDFIGGSTPAFSLESVRLSTHLIRCWTRDGPSFSNTIPGRPRFTAERGWRRSAGRTGTNPLR